jgi:hypothetical protein
MTLALFTPGDRVRVVQHSAEWDGVRLEGVEKPWCVWFRSEHLSREATP